MLKKILIFTIIAVVIMAGFWRLRDSHVTEKEANDNTDEAAEINNNNEVEEGLLKDDKSYVLSVSPHGDKKIVCTGDNELVLHVKSGRNETSKVIYEDYSPLLSDNHPLAEPDPYSMYSSEKYIIQWSQNERYIFVRDSIYDIETDKLIEIKSNVAFMWVGNKGLYMDNGYYYTMHFSDGYSNYMSVSKEINVFEEGDIRTLARAEDDRYFVLDKIHIFMLDIMLDKIHATDMFDITFDITDDCLVVNTASLKYKAEELQEIINKEYSGMVKAIYEEKGIGRHEYPEHVIVNGSYYLESISPTKISLD